MLHLAVTMDIAILKTIIVLAMLTAALATDLHWGKVPNWLTIPPLVVGILINAVSAGVTGLLDSLGAIGLVLSLWIVTMLLGGTLGGGDIKLLAALGAVAGFHFIVYALPVSVAIGGLIAVIVAIRRRALGASLHRLYRGIATVAIPHIPTQIGRETGTVHFPYATAIAMGSILTMLWTGIPLGK